MIISTDSTANLPLDYYKKFNISMIPMQILLNGEVYEDLSPKLNQQDFYKQMREGATPTTAQINEYEARNYFENLLQTGENIVHISFSSALSGSTASIVKVAEELNKNYKNKIYVIDSLNAACGEGMLVMYANDLKEQGLPANKVAEEVKKIVPLSKSYFTVQDLKYLVRGGRLSKISGFIGTVLNIKPILKVDENGKLVASKKVVSRRLAIKELANIVKDNIGDKKYVFINHTVCEEDATRLANSLKESLNVEPIITDLTQVIGCHTGPGLLAVFFMQKAE